MVLTLIAEVLSGETTITPGGPVDTDTACCLEAFTWDRWLEQVRDAGQGETPVDLPGRAAVAEGASA
jgi:hypothetical protein